MAKRTTTRQRDLIYDVGMHRGEDTILYLKKGFRVVGFEANPDLVAYCTRRFAPEIENHSLSIVSGAISDRGDPGQGGEKRITFYKNPVTIWGTIDPEWKARNEQWGWSSAEITVEPVDFAECIERYGMPYYMKIDIEGADLICLKCLFEFDSVPDYISIESSKTSFANIVDELRLLTDLGYDRFQAVQQASVTRQQIPNPPLEGAPVDIRVQADSSGLFGREVPGPWRSRRAILLKYRAITIGYRLFGDHGLVRRHPLARRLWQRIQKRWRRPIPGWYDTHAKRSVLLDASRRPS